MSRLVLTALTAAPAGAQTAAPTPPSDAVQAREAGAVGVVVRYRTIPWDPARLAAVTTPAADAQHTRALALGELRLERAMSLNGARLEAGHYSILCHGFPARQAEPVLRLVRFNGPAMLADEMVELARVEMVSRPPIRFDLAAGTTPALRISLTPTKRGVMLTVEYGNRRAVAVLRR